MSGDTFALTPPEPVAPVPVEGAAGLVPVDERVRERHRLAAEALAARLAGLDPRSPDFADAVAEALAPGDEDARSAARQASGALTRAVTEHDGTKAVTDGLAELRRAITAVDPASAAPRKLFGLVPRGGGVNRLVARYREASGPVNQLVLRLRARQDQLRRDNAAIKNERATLWDTMLRLSRQAAFAEALDEVVDREAGILDLADPARATALRSDVLHPVRQRRQDLLTQLAVSAQGYLALDLVRRTNDELIRGVERAATTTVAALRVAVAVSAALAGQRDVLDELDAVRGTTDALLRANGEVLAAQVDHARRVGSEPAAGIAAIQESFERVYRAMDAVDAFRADATRAMAGTVEALGDEVRRVDERLRRGTDTEGHR